jgi:hypothetical protein
VSASTEPGTFLKWLITHGVVLANWEGDAVGFCPCEGTLGELLEEYQVVPAEPYDARHDADLPLSRVTEIRLQTADDTTATRRAEGVRRQG